MGAGVVLIDRVLTALDLPDPEERRGNPIRGSRLGRCARQSAYMLWPDAFPPDPLPARAKLVFRFGDMIHDLLRGYFKRWFVESFGFEEARFHFKVPLSTKDAERASAMIRSGVLKGSVTTFAPSIRGGLMLDLAEPALYVPLHVDGIALTPDDAMASVEIKSMATGSFTRAVKGHVDYAYRVQMATACDATGLDTQLYIALNKNTCHAVEIVYTKHAQGVTVKFTKQSALLGVLAQITEGPDAGKFTPEANGDGLDVREWEAVEVSHPFEPHLLEQARQRVRAILRATPTQLPEREYGPTFTCETCAGTGTQTNNKQNGEPLKRGPKPCADCDATGNLSEAELPWQCRYCAYVRTCWDKPTITFDEQGKPHFFTTREQFEASGVTVRSPE